MLLGFCICFFGCEVATKTHPAPAESTGNETEIAFPLLVTSFPTSTIENCYVIILSEDGTIETYWGIRKAFDIDEKEYTYSGADWFAQIDAYKMSKLTEEEMAIIYDLFQQVPFSTISAPRGYVNDGREQMLFLDYIPFYTYDSEDHKLLAALIDQIVAYSPIEVVNIGWA
jgi:hypothetical protein